MGLNPPLLVAEKGMQTQGCDDDGLQSRVSWSFPHMRNTEFAPKISQALQTRMCLTNTASWGDQCPGGGSCPASSLPARDHGTVQKPCQFPSWGCWTVTCNVSVAHYGYIKLLQTLIKQFNQTPTYRAKSHHQLRRWKRAKPFPTRRLVTQLAGNNKGGHFQVLNMLDQLPETIHLPTPILVSAG